MSTSERDRRREALLDELRRLHRAEPAPAELRRRWLERADEDDRVPSALRRAFGLQPFGGGRAGVLVFGLRPRLALGVLAALAVVLGLRWVPSGWFGGDAGGLASNPLELAFGPEPRASTPVLVDPDLPAVRAPSRVAVEKPSGLCPLDALPRGAVLTPAKGGAPGLSVHTFEQQLPSCGTITRRYLELLPPGLVRRANAPVVILLHAAGESAEVMHARDKSRLNFEHVAQRNGIVLIYANAAPGLATSVGVADSGAWQTDARTQREVDDESYLKRLLLDLSLRNIIDLSNDVYLVGEGDGAAMALDAALRSPDRYTGVAAFEPSNAAFVEPALPRASGRLSRIMLLLEVPARGSVEAWRLTLPVLARRWGAVLGLDEKVVGHIWKLGNPDQPTGTLEYFDVALPATGSSGVRIYLLAGHVETPPSALHVWDFLTGIDGGDPDVRDDLPELPSQPGERLLFEGDELLLDDAPSVVLGEDVLTASPGSPRP